MSYQLHDSQINKIELNEDAIIFNFSQGFWTTDDQGKMSEQLKNCEIVYEIDRNDVPVEDFISVRVSKKGGAYKTVSFAKFVSLLEKSPFDVHMEYDCSFANSKMLQVHSNRLRIRAEIFIEEIKNVKYIYD